MTSPKFRTEFEPQHGSAVDLFPGIQRVTAPNESAFTFRGTNTYIVGDRDVAVIDPGPLSEDHLQTILDAHSR